MALHRYWVVFEGNAGSLPAGLGMGCGVTAADLAEGLALIEHEVLGGRAMPRVADVTEDVDVSTLDPHHVLPNIGPPSSRGVWFPRP